MYRISKCHNIGKNIGKTIKKTFKNSFKTTHLSLFVAQFCGFLGYNGIIKGLRKSKLIATKHKQANKIFCNLCLNKIRQKH